MDENQQPLIIVDNHFWVEPQINERASYRADLIGNSMQ